MKTLIFTILSIFIVYCKRPENKKFTSIEVDKYIISVKKKFKNLNLADIYENCFPNTLDTTVESTDNDTFIITGDIEAMWLRDSSFQAFPYIRFALKDEKLKKMLLNLIKRQSESILIDPYANAFNKYESDSPWQSDQTFKLVNGERQPAMNKKIWERKYELDSLISTLFFSYKFFEVTNDSSFINNKWLESLKIIVDLVKKEMRGTDEEDSEGGPEYFFQRKTLESFDSLHQGRGNPVGSCGLVKSMFRNSDDATLFAYNIPENAFMSVMFIKISDIIKKIDFDLALEMQKIGNLVRDNIFKFGIFSDENEKYFAYEIDCYGNHYFIDDPGYPSLLSLPFLGFIDKRDDLYVNTRKRILSHKNPYYFKGKIGDGVGSAHSERNFIWPLFTIMRVLTSDDRTEIRDGIELLQRTAEFTGFMHESVNKDDVKKFTRPWFAWANSFFGYMINDVIERYPDIILN